jgi:homoserine acetyltransferase
MESYLDHQGSAFTDRFDANSYLYITKAMDYFDITRTYGPLSEAFAHVGARYLFVSYSTDWLFPTAQSKEMVRALLSRGKDVSFIDIDSPHGHDAFFARGRQTDPYRVRISNRRRSGGGPMTIPLRRPIEPHGPRHDPDPRARGRTGPGPGLR